MPISIRRATAADVDALVPLLADLFSIEADFRPDADRQRRGLALLLEAPEQRLVLVAVREGERRGSLWKVPRSERRRSRALPGDGRRRSRSIDVRGGASSPGRRRGGTSVPPPEVLLGMVTVQLLVSTAEGGLSGLVEDMVVAAGERGRGIGRRLLESAEAWARRSGASRLQLLADRENAPALRFYERMGWRGTQLVCLRRGG